jgi:hypothetical protein
MPISDKAAIETDIVSIIQNISGRKDVQLDHFIHKDVGIYGSDGIIVLEEIEERFDLDLSEFVAENSTFLPRTWWDRVLRRPHGARYTDVRVKDLVDYVAVHAGEGRKLPRFF